MGLRQSGKTVPGCCVTVWPSEDQRVTHITHLLQGRSESRMSQKHEGHDIKQSWPGHLTYVASHLLFHDACVFIMGGTGEVGHAYFRALVPSCITVKPGHLQQPLWFFLVCRELLTSLSINAEDGQPFGAYLVLQEGTTQHCWPSPSSYILIAGEVLFPFLLCCIPS